MFNEILNVFKYPFLQRAFIAGLFICVCVAILGVSLVVKRFSMIGDGLSHVGFSAFSIACVLNCAPFFVSIPIVVLAAVFLLLLSENSKIKADSAIALISNSCLAIGVVLISITNGINKDVLNYMFGSILALNNLDLILAVTFSFVAIIVFIFSYNKIFSITFDEDFTKAVGVRVKLSKIVMAILTALIIVVGMKFVGALLISSLIVFPVISVSMIFKSFKSVVIFSAIDSAICFVLGFFSSFIFSIPTGAMIVIFNLVVFVICYFVSLFKKLKITLG